MQPRTRLWLGGAVIAWAAGLQVTSGTGDEGRGRQEGRCMRPGLRPPSLALSPSFFHFFSLSLTPHSPHLQAHMWWLQRQPEFQRAFPSGDGDDKKRDG